MARKKTYRPSTPLRYQYKMYRLFGGTAPETLVAQITQAMVSTWNANYGKYKALYEQLKNQPWFVAQPPGLRGLIRALAFYVSRELEKGVSESVIRERAASVFGLPADVVENVINLVRGFRE